MNAYLETRTYRPGLPVSAFSATDNNFLAHWHIDVEMVLVCEGYIRIGLNKESRVLGQGEMAIFGSTDIHYYDSRDLHSKIIVLIFRPELVGSPGGWPENLRFTPGFVDLRRLDKGVSARIEEIFLRVAAEINAPQAFSRMYISGMILELGALLLRNFPTNGSGAVGRSGKLPDIQRVQNAIQYIEDNYRSEISLAIIAEKSKLSPYYFSRLFRKFTGVTFREYLSRLRIAKAEELIKTEGKKIIDISFETGFNSIRTFNRTFKAVKGYPPTQGRAG